MDLRFTRPSLRTLDQAGTEVLVASIATDERPPHGVAGLVDWRLAGKVSHLLEEGFIEGSVGEVTLIPGRPKLPFDKLILFGVGERTQFNERIFNFVVDAILETLEGLRVRAAVVELPGRPFEGIAPERAADLLLERADPRRDHDVWTLVEDAVAQRAIAQKLQGRRRIRTVLA